MSGHIVSYVENHDGSRSRAKCSCGDSGPWHVGGAGDTWSKLDSWADAHIEAKS